MSPIYSQGPSGLTDLPNEIHLQILYRCAESFSLREMMQVCFVNKAFYQMGMEAIYESDSILQYAVYWDPVRRAKAFYEEIVEKEEYTYPCLLDESTEFDDEDDYDYLPRYFRAQADGAEDEAEPFAKSPFVLGNEFWIRLLTARTLGKIRTKPPTEDHAVLNTIAEHMMQYAQLHKSPCITSQEDAVRVVCEVAVKHGYIHDRRDFFIGQAAPEETLITLDETCCVVRDGLLGVAVYLNEPDIFKTILLKEQKVTCPSHQQDGQNPDQSSEGESGRLPTFTYPHVRIDNEWIPKSCFQRPECGRSLIRLSNPVVLAVQTDNMTCASILLDNLPEESSDREHVISDIIKVSGTPDKLKWLQYAINSDLTLTKFNIIGTDLHSYLERFGHTGWGSRKHGAKELSNILDTTTSLEVFNSAYNAIMVGNIEEEGVWWTKSTYKHEYGAHNIRSWATARIHRAVLDDCMPIVKRLVELGYHLGPNHSAKDLEDEEVQTLVDSEKPRDISLPLAVSRGDMEMVQLLFKIGAERNRKNVRKAIWVAMEQDRRDILEVLMEKGHPDELLNQRIKKIWIQKLKALGKEDMLPWVEKISGRQDELVFVHN
ncbi:uncharacterized protein B0J16DRAFT_331443 [Fusarium flagelliforme]|uniref:uncharacterized protein n=1 Tax=Fusarium flagelliforme TaxID=2675880 RepID=UPI001E8E3F8D|nr:uncharacterized protein B0J16DRAFT_331443 [Fusarium flagelliforme]KAH7198976.1 hypothetical protein B0J16DRAFT_331443 [Fusarium flagelliforme]